MTITLNTTATPIQPASTQELEGIAQEVRTRLGNISKDAIAIGHALLRAKELVPRGEWGSWLKANFNWSHSTALNFMRVAEKFGGPDAPLNRNGCELELPLKVLYALAAPSTPDAAAEIALFEFSEGKVVTTERVKALRTEAQAAPEALVTYMGATCHSLNGKVELAPGAECHLSDATFVADPNQVYVTAVRDGQVATFLVNRADVGSPAIQPEPEDELGLPERVFEVGDKYHTPSGDVVEVAKWGTSNDDKLCVLWPDQAVGHGFDWFLPHQLTPVQPSDASPSSLDQELGHQAQELGLPTSAVQVLPDGNRDHLHESPHDVDDRPGAVPLELVPPPMFNIGDKVVIKGCLEPAQRDPGMAGTVRQVDNQAGELVVSFPRQEIPSFRAPFARFELFVPPVELTLMLEGYGGIRVKAIALDDPLTVVVTALQDAGIVAEVSCRYV